MPRAATVIGRVLQALAYARGRHQPLAEQRLDAVWVLFQSGDHLAAVAARGAEAGDLARRHIRALSGYMDSRVRGGLYFGYPLPSTNRA